MAKEKYYLYIDESGLRYPEKEQFARDDEMDYFALGGILVKGSDRTIVIDSHNKFCSSWDINYPLHSSEIRGKRENFYWLKDDVVNTKFNRELGDLMRSIPVVGFAVIIDRVGYNNRYSEKYNKKPWWMCKTAFSILIERVSKHMKQEGYRFKIICENCGAKEENAIKEYFKDLRKNGTPFNAETSAKYETSSAELFQQIPYSEPRFQAKKNPILQLADLYLYPMVKGGYDNTYYPYVFLKENKKLIDSILPKEKLETQGIKYFCFDTK